MKIFYADNHFFGVDPVEDDLEFGDNIYYLGDIVDVKNVHKSRIFEAQELFAKIEKHAGNHYITGNHELTNKNMEHVTKDGVYLTHGDIFAWGEDGALEWRTKESGKGVIFRFFRGLVKNYKRKEGIGNDVGNDKFKEACFLKAMEHGCHSVVIGHKHPDRLQVEKYKSITIYVLPRGKTVIEEL